MKKTMINTKICTNENSFVENLFRSWSQSHMGWNSYKFKEITFNPKDYVFNDSFSKRDVKMFE